MQPGRSLAGYLIAVFLGVLAAGSCGVPQSRTPVNFLLITADDLEWSSVGVYGSQVEDITPSIDRLAAEGLRFTNAHVNIAICQPSRQSMMTGRYPHNIGAPGFQPIADDVPLLQESLRKAGYLNGSIGKTRHLQPVERFGWDLGPDDDNPGEGIWMHHLGNGRDIELYKQYMTEFLQLARTKDQPFWLMLNTHDPHKPFYGDGGEEFDYPVSRVYLPDEIEVPGYLPDLPAVREELARYYTSVRRADDIVGAILKILEDEGFSENTLVMFISDNGSSFPFSKANAYLNSTKTPWIIRWPGKIAPSSIDTSHFISGIDYMPTVLEVAGLPLVPNLDGKSFLPLLEGKTQDWRTWVFTEINTPFSGIPIHMRAIQTEEFGYIYNPFFGHEKVDIEGNDGPSWDAMVEAARTDPVLQARVDLFSNRVPEELYHYKTDPNALNNLVADPAYKDVLDGMREELAAEMARTDDFILERFEREFGTGQLARQKQKFDFDWRFSKGDFPGAAKKDFDDSQWQQLDVPHDWSISDAFAEDNPTGRPGGYASGGVAWYRKHFTLDDKDPSSRVSIEFGGVYENSEVWINGRYLGKRPFGYISFNYDLTPYLDFDGDNVLSVRVDNSNQPNARWYTGSGIYRHVWLIATNEMHIARHGVYATAKEIAADSAVVEVRTTIRNSGDAREARLLSQLYSADDKLVAEIVSMAKVSQGGKEEFTQEITVEDPELWSPDTPNLYRLRSTVFSGDEIVDEVDTTIGIREFSFSPDTGFSLNGKSMKFQGVNNHSDLGALGAAINDRVLERRLEILKAMGANAIRTAHNPPSEVLLDLADRMGFMVIDEAFDEWLESWPFNGVKEPEGKVEYGYHLHFDEWAEKDLIELVRRDRNHPSVILWSVGNEIPDSTFEAGTKRLKKLMDVVRKEDPTRPITAGITHMHLANATGFASQLDVTGYNGGGGSAFMYEEDREKYPDRIFLATEVPHSFQTRGVYRTKSWYRGPNPLGGIMEVPDLTEEEVFNDVPKFYSSSYDNAMVRIGARDSWRRTRDLPYMCGEFRWTGFDYLGETMFGWPAKFWNFGIIDMCGFPKDTYYFYQSQWTEEPMVHIFPHWNWSGKEGVEIPVVAYSNCDSVELFLNGESLGEQEMGDRMDLVWLVPYEPGVLSARGRRDGEIQCENEIETAGNPARIQLLADRETISADGQDVVHFEVNVLDAEDRFVPNASNRMTFKVVGDASIIAVDNGDPLNEDEFSGTAIRAFNGKSLAIVQATRTPGGFTFYAESDGLVGAQVSITTHASPPH